MSDGAERMIAQNVHRSGTHKYNGGKQRSRSSQGPNKQQNKQESITAQLKWEDAI
jgi:hypothetical protein